MAKIKDKEGILNAPRDKQEVTYEGSPVDYELTFIRNFAGQKGVA